MLIKSKISNDYIGKRSRRMNLRTFPILQMGKKKTKVKIDKKKYEFSYLTKKEYKQKTEEAEKHDEYVRVVGYTTLKQKSDAYIEKKNNNLICLLKSGLSDTVTV